MIVFANMLYTLVLISGIGVSQSRNAQPRDRKKMPGKERLENVQWTIPK